MKYLIGMLIGVILGSIAHEHDIARQCRINGETGMAGWFWDFKCQPLTQTSVTAQ